MRLYSERRSNISRNLQQRDILVVGRYQFCLSTVINNITKPSLQQILFYILYYIYFPFARHFFQYIFI